MQYTFKYNSPLGEMTIASDGESLTGDWFVGQKYAACTLRGNGEEHDLPIFHQAVEWFDCYFGGYNPNFFPPLRLVGSPFRLAVWRILQQIPYGEVTTYSNIAKEIACERDIETMSAQAVGGAVGHNPFAIIIPCHRVIGSNGSLTGYAGGIDRKIKLLEMEHPL